MAAINGSHTVEYTLPTHKISNEDIRQLKGDLINDGYNINKYNDRLTISWSPENTDTAGWVSFGIVAACVMGYYMIFVYTAQS